MSILMPWSYVLGHLEVTRSLCGQAAQTWKVSYFTCASLLERILWPQEHSGEARSAGSIPYHWGEETVLVNLSEGPNRPQQWPHQCSTECFSPVSIRCSHSLRSEFFLELPPRNAICFQIFVSGSVFGESLNQDITESSYWKCRQCFIFFSFFKRYCLPPVILRKMHNWIQGETFGDIIWRELMGL